MKWTDELIKEHLLESVKILNLNRMPTASELKSIGRNDLHCKISRTKKYSGWANELGLTLSRCETRLGNEYEQLVADDLKTILGFTVEQMTTKHPYDLLIDGSVKVDVKVANLYKKSDGTSWWTFNLVKENPTCDIYICIALDDDKEQKMLIIPSHMVKMKSLNVGRSSKYDEYNYVYDYITEYADFFRSIN